MAKAQAIQVSEPNLVLPLASSYTTRGIAGFTNTVTNALDARKINSAYELVKNSASGKQTLFLVKRPGVADVGSSYGTAGQVAYLWEIAAGATTNAAANRWVFSTSVNDIRASNTSATTVIATAAGYAPAYCDKTAISGTDTVVVQLRNASGTQTVWHSTAIATFTQITDSDFPNPLGKIEHLDGFAFALASTNRIHNSDLNSLSSWDANGYISMQTQQDIPAGLAKLGQQIIGFGMAHFEVFRNAGNATGSPLEAVQGMSQEYGLADPSVTGMRHYYAVMDGRLYWRGTNPLGVFTYNGQTVEKVSTVAIDKILAERQHYFVGEITFQGQKAIVIGLDLPSATTQRSLLFFPQWNDWFEWTSTVFIPQTSPRLTNVCLGVDQSQHKLYAISEASDNWQDAGTNFTLTHQFELPKDGNNRQIMDWFDVKSPVARSASSLGVEFSDDDGVSWSTARNIDLTLNDKRALWRCGSYTKRQVRLTHTANLDCRLESALARVR